MMKLKYENILNISLISEAKKMANHILERPGDLFGYCFKSSCYCRV